MIIQTRKSWDKSYKKLDQKIKNKVFETISIFSENPTNPILHNHKLKWSPYSLRSINVTWDYRILFIELSDNNYELVELIDVWTHSQLYK